MKQDLGVRVHCRDALTGELLGDPIHLEDEESVAGVAAKAVALTGSAEIPTHDLASVGPDPRLVLTRWAPCEVFEWLVRCAGATDRTLVHLQELATHYYFAEQPRYEEAVWRAFLSEIDPEDEDAALAYSSALWCIHRIGGFLWEFDESFRVLPERYAGSLPELFYRFSEGGVLTVIRKRHPAAAMKLLSVARELPPKLPPELQTPQILGSLYCETAFACYNAGLEEEAREFARLANAVVGGVDEPVHALWIMGLGRWSDGSLHLFRTVADCRDDSGPIDIREAAAELLAELTGESGETEEAPLSLPELAEAAAEAIGEQAYGLRAQYLDRFLAEGCPRRVGTFAARETALEFLNWLVARTWTEEQRTRCSNSDARWGLDSACSRIRRTSWPSATTTRLRRSPGTIRKTSWRSRRDGQRS